MKIVDSERIEREAQKNAPRQGRFEFQRLLEGTPRAPENFIFRMTKLDGEFYSPRHCHNFDQIRYLLEGWSDFGRNGKLTAGMVGYFPEGAAYGPQSVSNDALILALQFGGASGAGYLSAEEVEEAGGALRRSGRFEKGAYLWTDAKGKERSKDAYAAIWEHVHGRKFVAPKRRYRDPIFMDPSAYAWVASPAESGVSFKHLGSFSEAGTALDVYRLEAGAALALRPHSISFVLDGSGRIGTDAVRRRTAIHLERGERAQLKAATGIELLQITLPDLAALGLFSADRPAESYGRRAS